MNISVLSDLHLHFGKCRIPDGDSTLVIAGDSCEGRLARQMYETLLRNGRTIVFTTGNHEYLCDRKKKTDMQKIDDFWQEFSDTWENFHFLNNSHVTIDGQRFIGGTLWYNPFKGNLEEIVKQMHEYKYCWVNGRNINAEHIKILHDRCVNYLENNLKENDILVTHYPFSLSSLPEEIKAGKISEDSHYDEDDILTAGAYASDLEKLIKLRMPIIGIHGHIHESRDYFIGKTRVISNPRGYSGKERNPKFDVKHCVTVQNNISKKKSFRR